MVTSNLDFSVVMSSRPTVCWASPLWTTYVTAPTGSSSKESVVAPPDPYRRPQKRQLRNTRKSPNLDSVRDPDFGTLKWRHYADLRWRHIADR